MIRYLPSFKGYDAAPIKNLYIEQTHSIPIAKELDDVCRKENIKLRPYPSLNMWAQDDKCVVEKDGQPFMVAEGGIENQVLSMIKYYYGIQADWDYGFLTGGNTFIGKYPNGEKWIITGEYLDDKKDIAECYGVKEENIHEIPKPDFHLDLGIRPIGYPDILVNDPEIAEQNLEKLNDGSEEFKKLKNTFEAYKEGYSITYASSDEVCETLKRLGFNPIRIGGVYYNGINFMNAIVNKHPDGTMSYISNSSECKNHIYTKLQKVFEEELKSKVPSITTTYFIKGENVRKPSLIENNYIVDTLKNKRGGIHCMTLEEPDFKAWG